MNDVQISSCNSLDVPPAYLDLAWKRGADGRWIADATPLAKVAGALCRKGMSWEGLSVRDGLVTWDLSRVSAEPILSRRLAGWTRTARAELARCEERDARLRPIESAAMAAIQADLRDALAIHPWAFGLARQIAEGFAEAAKLTPGQDRFARSLLQDARLVVAAVDRRLALPAGQEDLAAARDADTREDLHEACRYLSRLDGDRCRDRNGRGWGAATSGSGHRLAAAETLTVLQAAHARQLVYPHRAQLPRALRDRLFGEA